MENENENQKFDLFLGSCRALTEDEIKQRYNFMRERMDQDILSRFDTLFPEISSSIKSLGGIIDLNIVREIFNMSNLIYSSKITNNVFSDVEKLRLKEISDILTNSVQPIMNIGYYQPLMFTLNYTPSTNYLDAWNSVNINVKIILEICRIYGCYMSISVIEHTHQVPKPHEFKDEDKSNLQNLLKDGFTNAPDFSKPSPLIYAITSVNDLSMLHNIYNRYYTTYPIKNIDIGLYVESLLNYLHCILYRSRSIKISTTDSNYFKDRYNFFIESIRNKTLDVYILFPSKTMKEYAIERGTYKLDPNILDPIQRNEYFRYIDYVEKTHDRIYEFNFWMFIAHVHNLNGQTTIGYPHIHITSVFKPCQPKEQVYNIQNMRQEIIRKTGLNDIVISPGKTNPPNYEKAFGYLFKNSKNHYTRNMIPFETIYCNSEPFVNVYFYNKYLRDNLAYFFIQMATPSNNNTQRSSNVPMNIYDNIVDIDIARNNLLIGSSLPKEEQDKFFNSIEKEQRELLLMNPGANINMTKINPKDKVALFRNFIQDRMKKGNLAIYNGYIYQKRDGSKRSYKDLCKIDSYINSFIACEECNVSEIVRKTIIDEMESKIDLEVNKDLTFNNFPRINIDFRMIEYGDFFFSNVLKTISINLDFEIYPYYTYNYYPDITLNNLYDKLIEFLRTSIWLTSIKFSGLYSKVDLRSFAIPLGYRFNIKKGTLYLVGESNTGKTELISFYERLFPDYLIGTLKNITPHHLNDQCLGKELVIINEGNGALRGISSLVTRGSVLELTGGEKGLADKKHGDISKLDHRMHGLVINANIEKEDSNIYQEEHLINRLLITTTKKSDIYTNALNDIVCAVECPLIILFISMCSNSIDYCNGEILPKFIIENNFCDIKLRLLNFFHSRDPNVFLKNQSKTIEVPVLHDIILNLYKSYNIEEFKPDSFIPIATTTEKSRLELINSTIKRKETKFMFEKLSSRKQISDKVNDIQPQIFNPMGIRSPSKTSYISSYSPSGVISPLTTNQTTLIYI